ncbi:S8 family serine peptidase [Actinophytocola xanthii]|uniref:Peptidase S8/S53 domain-containing protein n=1 Tax=Actinophytocola xanthii TaxID=1912961 RepID=A0A1Q8BZC3_9PSEU|nr:S8 family serine peptidase [Actinophytocola xanthii]OLF07438.1 hypothetical protein BU204_35610 [Actinophytocola xanthii]
MTLRRPAGLLAGAALVSTLLAGPLVSAEPSGAAPDRTVELTTITLLTGDEVRLRGGRVAGVRMAPGRENQSVWQYEMAGHQYVVPADAAPLVAAGRVDRRLFDVTELVRQGLDDHASQIVPLIVEGAPHGRSVAPGLSVVDADKDGTAWRRLSTARGAGTIHLNGRVLPALEESVPQVGAPTAWASGFRGDGVTVAVLDSGYDATHPDLRGVVDLAENFTEEGSATTDTVGHGTHVASTIAGRGGQHTGVAPGARLLVGKVLGEFGGTEANLIRGMHWAVEHGADVVNLSLGSGPGDGTDLVSRTLNELSASSGTLFVVAAGNSGAPSTVTAPGTADRALTVGSVTKDDTPSVFSSRGPRQGDYGLKPEISAPGSDIVAARAQGTNPADSVDERYVRMSGTSMAAPHVAGAAAVLAGQHPEWTGEQIKSALVGSTHRLPGVDTHTQGAGRLDLARGVAQRVRTEGLLGFGRLGTDTAPAVERTVTFVNDGPAPVTLDLALELTGAGAHRFTLDRPRVEIPARSSVAVAVTAEVPAEPLGEVSGALVATGDGVELTTPLTAHLPGQTHTLTVRVRSGDDEPERSMVLVQNEATGEVRDAFLDGDTATFVVPTGHYRVLGRTQDTDTSTDTLYVLPTRVAGDTELVVDTTVGRPVTSSIDDPQARVEMAGGHAVSSAVNGKSASMIRPGKVTHRATLKVLPSPPMDGVALHHFSYWTHPFATVTVQGPGGFELESTYVSSYPRFTGSLTADVVQVGHADRAAIDAAGDVRGKIALIAPVDWDDPQEPPGEQLREGIELLAERGAKLVLSFFNPQWDLSTQGPLALPVVMTFDWRDVQQMQELAPIRANVIGRANSPADYFLADAVHGGIPAGHAFDFHRRDLGRIDRTLVDTQPHGTYRYMPATFTLGGFQANADVEVAWPARRTEHVSPGVSLTMYGSTAFDEQGRGAAEFVLPVTLEPGERRRSRVFGAPFGPELTTPHTSQQDGRPMPWAYRQRDRLTLSVPMFADSDPGNAGDFDPTSTGSTVVRSAGRELGRRDDVGGLGTFDLPAGPGRFEVEATASRPAAGMDPALSTRTSAVWTFHAPGGTAERVALPLLDVRFDLPLDDHNRAPAGERLRGAVTAVRQPGAGAAGVRSIAVEVSYDEGKTWRKATVDGARVVVPPGGAAGGFASLRAVATDRDGNEVTETVIRAYALR